MVGAGFGHLPHQHGIAVVDVARVLLEGVAQRGQHGVGLQLGSGLEGGGVLSVLALLAHQLGAGALKGVDLEITVGSLLHRNNIARMQPTHSSAGHRICAGAGHCAGGVAVAYLAGNKIMGIGKLIHKLARHNAASRVAGNRAGIVAGVDLRAAIARNAARFAAGRGNSPGIDTLLDQAVIASHSHDTARTGIAGNGTGIQALVNLSCI